MCTVTYLPKEGNNFILTSNRDETPLRKTIPPQEYQENGVGLTYPKDEIAGGTWIGTSKKNRLVCLLNGGYIKHKRKLPYKMSRGIIVKSILSVNNAVKFINDFNFENIEPFTLILIDWNSDLETFELVWDGVKKHFNKLEQKPKIWSSSTLYNSEMKKYREDWFANWLIVNKDFKQEEILNFHKNEKLGNPEISPKMKRNFVQTVSITSVEKNAENIAMQYFDLLQNAVKNIEL